MDKPVMRDLLKELIRLGLATGNEYAGVIVRNTETHVESFIIDSISPLRTCKASKFETALVPSGFQIMQIAHYHPGVPGNFAPCIPGGRYEKWKNRLPSPNDWNVAQQLPLRSVVVDPNRMASFGAVPLTDSMYVTFDDGTQDWIRVPKPNQMSSMYTEVSRNGNGCTRP
jgi:hypothetical protein